MFCEVKLKWEHKLTTGSMGKLVNPFASHAKDPQFEPGWNHCFFVLFFGLGHSTCLMTTLGTGDKPCFKFAQPIMIMPGLELTA